MCAARPYDPVPCYECVGGEVVRGWRGLCADVPSREYVIAIDGPEILEWERLVASVVGQLRDHGTTVTGVVDLREHMAPWEQQLKRTAPAEELVDDPDFATIPDARLGDLLDRLPSPPTTHDGVGVVFGPGAALVPHDTLWYADLPKRYAEAAVNRGDARNLGQSADDGPPTTRRLFYVDWPVLDRHRDAVAPAVDRWIDAQDLAEPRWIDGATLRATLHSLSTRPFRTRPTFNTTSWGGHWGQDRLRLNVEARNSGLGYELIAPESGILLGNAPDHAVEVPFQLLVALHPHAVLGTAVHEQFGTSFPIRFDYLDTFGGGNLSVHCHPGDDYMRSVFGGPYAQHETYYIMVGSRDNVVYLGLREDADIDEFQRRAHDAEAQSVAFGIEEFVQTFRAEPHQLFLVPAGTPHGSGKDNVVLEVSATPYLYSLRFYDWLRQDADGAPRPVHVHHAFRNLDTSRTGENVRRDLVQRPRVIDHGPGWQLELIGRLPEMFFDVQRLVVDAGAVAQQETGGRFHVLNLVDGGSATIRTVDAAGNQQAQAIAYAETLLIPASVEHYEVIAGTRARLVRAVVR